MLPCATQLAPSRATRPLPGWVGQQTTASGLPHVERAAQRTRSFFVAPLPRHPALRSAFRSWATQLTNAPWLFHVPAHGHAASTAAKRSGGQFVGCGVCFAML